MALSFAPHQVPAWVLVGCGLFGALWGSFLNVVIVRLPRGQSVVSPPSHCVACGAPIRYYDNVPVLSYLLLRGRCRQCGAPYSPRYAAIELIAGLCAVWSVNEFGFGIAALGYFVFLALLLAIGAIDLEHWIIPHELTWPGIALGLAFAPFNPRVSLRSAVAGAFIAFALFTLLAWVAEKLLKREALGLGDRWLLAMEGAFLGVGALLPVVFLASVQGSIVGLLLIAMGRAQTGEPPVSPASDASDPPPPPEEEEWVPPKNAIPFGPFLAIAGAEWLLVGAPLLDWYHRSIERILS
jgi:leader peptidase (prepilin peptidase)/N-methyltransferase